jgi:hypothetical protein
MAQPNFSDYPEASAVRIYKITSKQAGKLHSKENPTISDKYLETLFDSLSPGEASQKQLPAGHYIYCHLIENQEIRQLWTFQTMQIRPLTGKGEFRVQITDFKGKPLRSAQVKWRGKTLKHEGNGIFTCKTNRKRGLLKAQNGDEEYLGWWYEERYRNPPVFLQSIGQGFASIGKAIARPFSRDYKGYIAFSSPKYKPGDTLRAKAWIVNQYGKPLRRKLDRNFYSHSGNSPNLKERVKPDRPGTFLFELPLHDSLKLDCNYTLRFSRKRWGVSVVYSTVRYEDYLLREATFKVESEKRNYAFEDTVRIEVKALDANNLGLAGAEVDLKVYLEELERFGDTRGFCPEILWKYKGALGPEGRLSLVVPQGVFQGIKGIFHLKADFRTGDNELATRRKRIVVDGLGQQESTFTLEAGNLVTENITGTGRLLGFAGRDTLVDQAVELPLLLPIDTLVNQYVLLSSERTMYLSPERKKEVALNSTHRGDSIEFSLKNPHQLPVRYEVREGHGTIGQGITREENWTWKRPAKLKSEYRMEVAFHWAGKPILINETASARLNNLQVSLQHPERVHPGESVQMKVEVLNAKGEPVPNADLTSSAVSGKFNRSNIPSVPSFPEKIHTDQNVRQWIWQEHNRTISSNHPVDGDAGKAFAVDSTEWFRMLFPPGGWYSRFLETPDGSTQFAPFLPVGANFARFNAIWIDGKLVSFEASEPDEKYSFRLDPGFHHLKLRTAYYSIEVENVWFSPRQKLELFIDPESPPAFCRVTRERWRIPKDDLKAWNDQLLWIFDADSGRFGRIGQGKLQRLTGHSRMWQNAGVFQPGPVWFIPGAGADTVWIDFEPGTSYLLRDGFLFHDRGGEFQNRSEVRYLYGIKARSGEFANPPDKLKRAQETGGFRSYYRMHSTGFDAPLIGQGELYLKTKMSSRTTYLLLIRENDRRAIYFEPYTKQIDHLEPGSYQFWACNLDGSYHRGPGLEIVEEGSYFLELDQNDFTAAKRPEALNLHSGRAADWDLLEERLFPEKESYLTLQLVDELDGKPLRGAKVSLKQNYSRIRTLTTDESGKVVIRFPVEGWYTLELSFGMEAGRGIYNLNYLWKSGQEQFQMVKVPAFAPAEDSRSGRAFPGTLSLDLNISFKRRVKCPKFGSSNLPPRRGTRTIYINEMSQNDQDIVFGMQRQNTDSVANYFIPGPQESQAMEFSAETDQLRSTFADQAWWQPNLTTDKNGEAYFQVTFPDDLSRWDAWAAAVSRKKQSGLGRAKILSYRDLVARLSVPRFLIEGDQTQLRGEVVNHTGVETQLTTSFEINGKVSAEQNHDVTRQFDESYPLTATGDSMQVNYRLKRADGYGDGEARPIEVLPRGLLRKTGGFAYLDGNGSRSDTVFTINADPSLGPVRLLAEARPIDFLLTEIEKLEKYPYSCMEQTASRLIALLAKKRIATAMSERFRQNDDIKSLIRRLENAQQPNGSWGWWFESTPNLFMTAVVCQALQSADEQGYSSDALPKGKSFLLKYLPRETSAGNLGLLLMAAELGITLDYEARLGAYGMRRPSIYDRLQIARIKQLAGLKIDWDAIWEKRKESISGGLYWGEASDDLLTNSVQATLIVYRMLETMEGRKSEQSRLGRFFLEQGGAGLGRNTFESASVLNALLPYYLSQPFRNSDGVVLEVARQGSVKRLENFPAEENVPPGEIRIRKSGAGPVFLHWYQEKREEQPQPKNEYFKAISHFEQGGKQVDSPVSGQALTLVVNVEAISPASFVMVEVPIPAGCVYGDKSVGRAAGEVHREYFRDRVGIFLTEMPEGSHTFKIELEPRFPGDYTLNPIEVMPMYFPILTGNNEVRRVEIR